MIALVGSKKLQRQDKMSESQKVLKAVVSNVQQQQCRLWMAWASKMVKILLRTSRYAEWMGIDNVELKAKWEELIENGSDLWAKIVGGVAIEGEALDEGEELEANLYAEVANGPEDFVIEEEG